MKHGKHVMLGHYRRRLRVTVGSSAAPYGFTLATWTTGAALALLRRRRLGQLAVVSALVALIGAAAGFLLEAGAQDAPIAGFGDALWWSAALLTTVGSELYPVTVGGRLLGFFLMLYAVGVFSYFVASVASVLVGLDAGQTSDAQPSGRDEGGIRLSREEVETPRQILEREDEARG